MRKKIMANMPKILFAVNGLSMTIAGIYRNDMALTCVGTFLVGLIVGVMIQKYNQKYEKINDQQSTLNNESWEYSGLFL